MGRWLDMFLLRKKTCVVCHRVLKTPRAKALGMGAKCARKNPGLAEHRRAERAGQLKLPMKGGDHGEKTNEEEAV